MLPTLESESFWIVDGWAPGINGENLCEWHEDDSELRAVLAEYEVFSAISSVFSQQDEIVHSLLKEKAFEMLELSTPAVSPVIKMSTQQVLSLLEELCMQHTVVGMDTQLNADQNDPVLEPNIRQLYTPISEGVFRELLDNEF